LLQNFDQIEILDKKTIKIQKRKGFSTDSVGLEIIISKITNKITFGLLIPKRILVLA